MSESSKRDFSDLEALFLNCTLKRSPEISHTEGLIEISKAIMEKNGVSVEVLRAGDIPAHGNQRSLCVAGCRFDHPNPEYR